MIALAFIRAHWRALLVCLLVAGAFAAGYGAHRPADRVVEHVTYQDRIVEKRVEVKVRDTDSDATRVVYVDRIVRPDGTREEHEVVRSEKVVHEAEKVTASAERTEARLTTRDLTIEPSQSLWRVALLLGATDFRLLPPGASLTYGALVERRIIGPFSVGVWGLTLGPTLGVSLSFQF